MPARRPTGIDQDKATVCETIAAQPALGVNMDQDAIARYITDTFDGVDVAAAAGDSFFFYDPDRNLDPARRLPFATIVTNDSYDRFSNLSRPSVFRLNVGVGPATYRTLFGAPAAPPDGAGGDGGSYDFTALDTIMPHPVYGRMFWVCVLNPTAATFQTVRPLLAEAYERSVRAHARARSVDGA